MGLGHDYQGMFAQIAIGTALITITAIFAGFGFFVIEKIVMDRGAWFTRPPFAMWRVVLLCLTLAWFLIVIFAAVTLWAGAYLWLDIFATFEEAFYFSIVSYTTLGFGDVLLPQTWRLLSGIEALNGLLMVGLQISMLTEILRQVRQSQVSDGSK